MRIANKTGANSGFNIQAANGVSITNSITEGGNPTYNIYFDAQNSTTVKLFYVKNLHSENSPSDSIIRLVDNGGIDSIDGVFRDSNHNRKCHRIS